MLKNIYEILSLITFIIFYVLIILCNRLNHSNIFIHLIIAV